MVNALLNNPGLLCCVIAYIKWHFKKIIIVLELIDVFTRLRAWNFYWAEGRDAVRKRAIMAGRLRPGKFTLPGFPRVQVLLLAKEWRKFKPSALKGKRQGGQAPPRPKPGCPPTAAQLWSTPWPRTVNETPESRQRSHLRPRHPLRKHPPLHPSALAGYPRGGTSEPPKTPQGSGTSPPPLSPSVISADSRGEPP